MEINREIFLQEINKFIIISRSTLDKEIIKSKYLELVKKYHPDVNNEIDKNILNEYMVIINNSFEKIMNNNSNNVKHKNVKNNIQIFNFDTFLQLLNKIVEIGINKETMNGEIFNEYKDLLLLEIEKSNKYASEAFKLLLAEKTIIENRKKMNLFNNGIAHYMYLLRSVPASAKEKYRDIPNVHIANRQTEKVADSYLNEYKNYCKEDEQKDAIKIIMEWLKEANIKYRKH
jgi:curved DNA-binding protein CbpA